MPPDYDGQPDSTLLRAIAAGDERAFMALYDRHGSAAFGLAWRILGDAPAVEEAVQDAFMHAWSRAASFEDHGGGSARGWLMTIVHHRAIDTHRRLNRHDRRAVTLDERLELRALGGTWEAVAERITAAEMRAVLDELPADQARAIELAYFGGLSQREIAEREAMPLGTVKGRIRLGLNKLRTLLDQADRDAAAASER